MTCSMCKEGKLLEDVMLDGRFEKRKEDRMIV